MASGGVRVLVVGGGIAGLATARALRLRGIEAHVVERSATRSHSGAGVYLPANAVRAIGELGLADELAVVAHRIPQQRFLDHRGRTLFEVDLAEFWGETGPCLALSHADLHELLADGVPVRRGATVTGLDDAATGEYDVVVGADGVHSSVRSAVSAGREPRFLGQVSWRVVVPDGPQTSAWTVWLGRHATFLAVPIGGGRTYCYAAVDRRTAEDEVGGDAAVLAGLFRGFAEPVRALLATPRPEPAYFSPIVEVVQETWVHGRVVLVGDAAHAMSPNMAEGVGMAVEDALVLGETIAAGRPLAGFEARRRPRVGHVQAQTHRRDRTRNLPPWVRDPVLRRLGPQIFRGNYEQLLTLP